MATSRKKQKKKTLASRRLNSTLPRPSRAQVKSMLGPFATSAQVDAHFRKHGNGLGAAGGKCVVVQIPPTTNLGSYSLRYCTSPKKARQNALEHYNDGRRQEGLPILQRLPAGTKVKAG